MSKFFHRDIQWYLVHLVSLGRPIPKGFANVIWIVPMGKSSKLFDVVITYVCVIPNTVSKFLWIKALFLSIFLQSLALCIMLLGIKWERGNESQAGLGNAVLNKIMQVFLSAGLLMAFHRLTSFYISKGCIWYFCLFVCLVNSHRTFFLQKPSRY